MPARVAAPQGLTGLVDKLEVPAHATGAGLMHFARRLDNALGDQLGTRPRRQRRDGPDLGKALGGFFGRLLPDE